jgi:large subunit ribosomal protein L32
MPNPRQRHSNRRRKNRRSHDALTAPAVVACAECGEPTLAHRVCPSCGMYKGRAVVETKEE